jgi:glyoxylase-like metal-dependent hydrolase (beta-lactamase superfamily II)
MIQRGVPDAARPYNTYFEPSRDFPFNGEAVVLYHNDSSVTDGDTVVFFRRSDVIAAGDVFRTDSFPVIDVAAGGSIDGTIAAVNRLLDLTVPSKMLQEGGTYVIPGHGRISDEHEVVWYRDMLVIIRDRVKELVARKMTLDQVKAARPALDYEGRYGSDTGAYTTAMFIEAVYRSLTSQGARP